MDIWALKRIRKERDMTQAQLANKIGVTVNTVNNWEMGRTKPDIDLFADMAKALGMKPSALIEQVIK